MIVIANSPEEFEEYLAKVVDTALAKFSANTPAKPKGQDLLTKVAVCKQLGVSKTTLTEWMKSGVIPYIRLGRRIYFEAAEVITAGKAHTKYQRRK